MRHKLPCLLLGLSLLMSSVFPIRQARADMFGADIPILIQILVQAVDQVIKLQQIIGKAKETVSILEDMNRGVKEVLRIAETSHIPIPPGVYAQAKTIDQAVWEAKRVYGAVAEKAPLTARTHFRSGVEGLTLSQDAFDYSTFLDAQGESIKRSAVVANQASATRLTAESLGVLLHSMSHSNRIQAKELELNSTDRLEKSAQENARFESFINTHSRIEEKLKSEPISSLNEVTF